MNGRHFALAALVALAAPAVAHAVDTVYFAKPGGHGIDSVSGTIVQETANLVEVVTEDGRRVVIRRSDVFQVVRDAASPAPPPDFGPAPSPSSRVYHFGLEGGMNISNLSVDPGELEDDDSLRSWAVGAWWGIPLSRRLTIRTGALYSVKGDAETDGGYTASTKLSYLDVPVVAKIGFLHDGAARPSLFLGPSVAFNLSARSKLEGGGGDLGVDVKDHVRKVDLGLVLGGGVDVPVGTRTVGLELRYSRGLSNAVSESANGTARNDVLALMGTIGLQ